MGLVNPTPVSLASQNTSKLTRKVRAGPGSIELEAYSDRHKFVSEQNMQIYALHRKSSIAEFTWRVGPLHSTIFNGIGLLPNKSPQNWKHPSLSNSNRDPIHLTRSGTCTPAFFMTLSHELIVSKHLKRTLSKFKGIDFNEVVFEHLVDLPMPAVGDFSWLKRDDLHKYDSNPDIYLKSLPHNAELLKNVGQYYHLLVVSQDELKSEFTDLETLPINFGSYAGVTRMKSVEVSMKMMEKYPIAKCRPTLIREDVFATLAPYIDLDYISVSVGTIGKPRGSFDIGRDGLEWIPD